MIRTKQHRQGSFHASRAAQPRLKKSHMALLTSGTRVSGGVRQAMWKPRRQRSHSSSRLASVWRDSPHSSHGSSLSSKPPAASNAFMSMMMYASLPTYATRDRALQPGSRLQMCCDLCMKLGGTHCMDQGTDGHRAWLWAAARTEYVSPSHVTELVGRRPVVRDRLSTATCRGAAGFAAYTAAAAGAAAAARPRSLFDCGLGRTGWPEFGGSCLWSA